MDSPAKDKMTESYFPRLPPLFFNEEISAKKEEEKMKGDFLAYFDDWQVADCLATMRAKECGKRHPQVAMDRYFKGVCRKSRRADGEGRDDPATYMPPRRLWSRVDLKARQRCDRSSYNKRAIMRHVRWVIGNDKLEEYAWGLRFREFAERIRARVKRGDFNFEAPCSFVIKTPGKDPRFVTSFLRLEDKVILRQIAKYLREMLDDRLSPNCYSFREDGSVDHTTAVKALIDYRMKHKGEVLWVAECDIRKFFDVIDHEVAWKAFARMTRGAGVDPLAGKAMRKYLDAYTSTESLLEGVRPSLHSECEKFLVKVWDALAGVRPCVSVRHVSMEALPRKVGVPQGGALSPLVANWVLDLADRRVERRGDADLFYARFCDDIVIVHPDKRKCRLARDRYLRTLTRLLLPYHKVKNRISYGRKFYGEKSKGPYCWRELHTPNERGVSPWVSFLGNQVSAEGEVRVRRDSVSRHVEALKAERKKFLGLLAAAHRAGSGIVLRKGTKAHPISQSGAIRAMMKSMAARGVGYLRAGPFAARSARAITSKSNSPLSQGNMCWMSAFPDIVGHACELQLRRLDAMRARILYPLQKKAGTNVYLGRYASYCGFFDRVSRPGIGKGRRSRVARMGYSGL